MGMKYYIEVYITEWMNVEHFQLGFFTDMQENYGNNYNELLYHFLRALLFDGYYAYYRIVDEKGNIMISFFSQKKNYIIYNLCQYQKLNLEHIKMVESRFGAESLRFISDKNIVFKYLYNKYKQ